MINYDDFQKVELKIGKILAAERVIGSEKLLRLEVDLGEQHEVASGEPVGAGMPAKRQILAGIGKVYAPENLVGKEIVVVANLEPRMFMGMESQGMLLAASSESGPILLMPDKEAAPGASIG